MKLTENQIQKLYKFTMQHYVYHYDVQTELVDHLANDIEQIWEENPNLTFEQARDKSFKKFGIFGFMDVVEQKQKKLGKAYRSILWKYFKEWFTIPRLLTTVLIFSVFYTLMSFNINKDYLSVFMLILGIIDVYFSVRLNKKAKARFLENSKKFLLADIIFKAGAYSSILVFSNIFQLTLLLESTSSNFQKVFISALLTFAILYSYISLFFIPNKADELLQETYPEYKLVKNL